MIHPEFTKVLVRDHLERLRRDARVVRGLRKRPVADTRDVELRLCRVADDSQTTRSSTASVNSKAARCRSAVLSWQ
jgi:hypothetical protein